MPKKPFFPQWFKKGNRKVFKAQNNSNYNILSSQHELNPNIAKKFKRRD